jgi:hypothetical protein
VAPLQDKMRVILAVMLVADPQSVLLEEVHVQVALVHQVQVCLQVLVLQPLWSLMEPVPVQEELAPVEVVLVEVALHRVLRRDLVVQDQLLEAVGGTFEKSTHRTPMTH